MNDVIFAMLKQEEVDAFWKDCRPILQTAFRHRVHVHSVDDYYPQLMQGELQLWVALRDDTTIGAVVTSVDEGSAAKVCSILSLAGKDLPSWIGLVDTHITDFARNNGCVAVEAVTRRGFSRFVPDFVEDGIVYIKMTGIDHGKET